MDFHYATIMMHTNIIIAIPCQIFSTYIYMHAIKCVYMHKYSFQEQQIICKCADVITHGRDPRFAPHAEYERDIFYTVKEVLCLIECTSVGCSIRKVGARLSNAPRRKSSFSKRP